MRKILFAAGIVYAVPLLVTGPVVAGDARDDSFGDFGKKACNVIFFVGDGMGVSTVTSTRIFSVGVDGELVMDQMHHTPLSRTSTTDHITPDSAGTITAMMTGVNTNSGIIGMSSDTERNDFNGDCDGAAL
jgi:alkaline phosphatase